VNLLAWRGLSPSEASPEQQVLRARLIGSALAATALAATAWAGWTLGGGSLALASTLVTGTMILFIRQARVASYDTYLMAFATAAVAAGLASMRAPSARARMPSGALAGLFLGAATMSKGPLAWLFVLGPLGLVALTDAQRRGRNLLGLLAISALAAAICAPWYAHIVRHVPEALHRMGVEFQAARKDVQPPWYYVGLVALVFPWTAWFLAALWDAIADRRHAAADARGTILLWLFPALIAMSFPAAKQQRYIVPLLPAAGLLIAHFLTARAGSSRAPPWLLKLHGPLLMAASVVFGVGTLAQDRLVSSGLMPQALLAEVPPGALSATASVLLVIGLLAFRATRIGDARGVLVLTAAWMAVAATVGFYGYARGPKGSYAHRAEAEKVRDLAAFTPVWHLRTPGGRAYEEEPDERFFFYFRRPIPPTDMEKLEPLRRQGRAHFIIVRDTSANRELLARLGYAESFAFHCGRKARVLYEFANRGGATSGSLP
jgi:4-amino-4-deoxy-L-arabinose transferase-like glycosyltransferase